MRPLKLTLQAFGSYGEKQTVDFTVPEQNLFLVTGNTGSGKSTIFDAIVFALFGEASSGTNKKDGQELQSHFADVDLQPFVELVFSVSSDPSSPVYTVKRIPRHVRKAKNRKGSETVDVKEEVMLTLPDQSVFSSNQKATDQKLVELVGLTKNQFMQVAMIAQGEFMEVLRAETSRKKEIFRKLFSTGIYERIVNELNERKKSRQNAIDAITRMVQQQVGSIDAEEQSGIGETLLSLKKEISKAESLNIVQLEALLEELAAYNSRLSSEKTEIENRLQTASGERNRLLQKYGSALQLHQAQVQYQQTKAELDTLLTQKVRMRTSQQLARQIQQSYALKKDYDRVCADEHREVDYQNGLKAENAQLPGRQADYADKQHKAQKALQESLDAAAKASETEQKVRQALNHFQSLEETVRELNTLKEKKETQQRLLQTAENKQAQFQRNLDAWKREQAALADTPAEREKLNGHFQVLCSLEGQLKKVQDAAAQQRQKERALALAQQAYRTAREQEDAASEAYQRYHTRFLDAQAGLLAQEKLEEGKPCPVCGSLHHPNPCRLTDQEQNLTREGMEKLRAEAEEKRGRQEETSRKANVLQQECEILAKNLEAELYQLQEAAAREIGVRSLEMTAETISAQLVSYRMQLEAEKRVISEKFTRLLVLNQQLETESEETKKRSDEVQQCKDAVQQLDNAISKKQGSIQELNRIQIYASPEQAMKERKEVQDRQKAGEQAYREAEEQAGLAKEKLDKTQERIQYFRAEIPKAQLDARKSRTEYTNLLAQSELKETDWQAIVQQYREQDGKKLEEAAAQYQDRKNRLEGACHSLEASLEGKTVPDLDMLEAEKQQAADRVEALLNQQTRLEKRLETNTGILKALTDQKEERNRKAEEFQRIDRLYRSLAGKESNARMDLETHVLRYYLERILYHANIRFREMSAGEYELRMMEDEQAAIGRNRGLDLTVFSMVTGKEREIRTLSGGESFMAALSLALGMADQIQESAASINLDMMFIDEGFGSLDDHSRNQAVRVLKEMSGSSKLIGIISHVTELKQEIEDKLVITKDDKGSHAEWRE